MRDAIAEVLSLQPEWSADNSPAMQRRGVLIRDVIPAWLRGNLPDLTVGVPRAIDDLTVTGRNAVGNASGVPWVRIYSKVRSPKATEGWYVVYLFSAQGRWVYVSLNQGTTRWQPGKYGSGSFVPLQTAMVRERAAWARTVVAPPLLGRPELLPHIDLESRGRDLGGAYEAGNVLAFRYPADDLPSITTMTADLATLLSALGDVYLAADLHEPGDAPPEVRDAIATADAESAPRRPRRRNALTHPERIAIEKYAVERAKEFLELRGWVATDVGERETYDIDARHGTDRIWVEVKGTTSPGLEVVLTKNEVDLYHARHPSVMLIVVADIQLDRKVAPPKATGGQVRFVHPWSIDHSSLTAIQYRYSVPPLSDP